MYAFFKDCLKRLKDGRSLFKPLCWSVVRDQHGWISLDGTRYDAFGTDRKLYVYEEGLPSMTLLLFEHTEALTNPFTTNGTATVLVTDSGHGCETG
jgi:hypothetical protein